MDRIKQGKLMWWIAGLLTVTTICFIAGSLNVSLCANEKTTPTSQDRSAGPSSDAEPLTPLPTATGAASTSREAPVQPAATTIADDLSNTRDASGPRKFTVTATEVEEARLKLEGARKFFGGYFHPFDSIALTAEELAVAENLIEERNQKIGEVAGREDAGELTHEEAAAEIERLDLELGEGFGALLGEDRMEVFVGEAPKFFREEGVPAMEKLYKQKTDEADRQIAAQVDAG